jgi:hypothetical protein
MEGHMQLMSEKKYREEYNDQKEEMTRTWREMHNDVLHNSYRSPNSIRRTKCRRMRWCINETSVGKCIGTGDLDVDDKIM